MFLSAPRARDAGSAAAARLLDALTERQRAAIQAALGGMPLTELARRRGVKQGPSTRCFMMRGGD